MPLLPLNPTHNLCAICGRLRGVFPLVPSHVAVRTSCDDVVRTILAACTARSKVFGGATQSSCSATAT